MRRERRVPLVRIRRPDVYPGDQRQDGRCCRPGRICLCRSHAVFVTLRAEPSSPSWLRLMFPKRIVCLTEETTETLYLLGEGDRVVGISGYTVRPPEARQKPKVSSFLHARYEKIEALKPDLILAFSDLQADISNDLTRRGYPVFTFNQRSVAEILQMICVLGAIVGVAEKGEALARDLEAG